ncbi:hypothetical protein [Hymenobacter crusticola]|uniref:DUF4158 domain-containing protein n=1 Tax=Hymenobacter crusticola TaxID=1770526 RepID=A0A243W5Z2_9BACT|nr:hypothetical protein [Hymenobacter crusticola]OUJ69188.1 hypothetical protein BXP70_26740 [Hymenobacter crusticola]
MSETASNRRYPALSFIRVQAQSRPADYTLEQRVQKRYHSFLFDGLQDLYGLPAPEALDYVLETSFPTYFNGTQRERCQQYWQAEERVQHDVPEVIRRLPRAELEQVDFLLTEQDLIGAIRLVWFTFRPRLHTLDRPLASLSDRKLYSLTGLGTLSRRSRAKAKKTPALPTTALAPAPDAGPCSRCSAQILASPATPLVLLPARAPAGENVPPSATPPAATVDHHRRVKRAQERKRLQRKRR